MGCEGGSVFYISAFRSAGCGRRCAKCIGRIFHTYSTRHASKRHIIFADPQLTTSSTETSACLWTFYPLQFQRLKGKAFLYLSSTPPQTTPISLRYLVRCYNIIAEHLGPHTTTYICTSTNAYVTESPRTDDTIGQLKGNRAAQALTVCHNMARIQPSQEKWAYTREPHDTCIIHLQTKRTRPRQTDQLAASYNQARS